MTRRSEAEQAVEFIERDIERANFARFTSQDQYRNGPPAMTREQFDRIVVAVRQDRQWRRAWAQSQARLGSHVVLHVE